MPPGLVQVVIVLGSKELPLAGTPHPLRLWKVGEQVTGARAWLGVCLVLSCRICIFLTPTRWFVLSGTRVFSPQVGEASTQHTGAEWERLYAASSHLLPSGFSPSGLPRNVQIVGNLFLPVEVLHQQSGWPGPLGSGSG
jgi:hypothetical protein